MSSRTVLYNEHVALGARIFEFGGWEMPLWYSSIGEEHMAVRARAGIFDASHMGKLLVSDPDGELGGLMTRDLKKFVPGRCVYAHVLDEKGCSLDDIIVTKLTEDDSFVVCNASTRGKVVDWLMSHRSSMTLRDVTMDYSCLAVQGPEAPGIVADAIGDWILEMRRYHAAGARIQLGGDEEPMDWMSPIDASSGRTGVAIFVSRTGYTGEDGFEIFAPSGRSVDAWKRIMSLGSGRGILPIGLGARDTLRLEMCYLLSGHDFDGTRTPLESDAEFAIDWNHEFVGKTALERQKGMPFQRLVAFESLDKGIPRDGYPLLSMDGGRIGTATSGTMSPSLKKGIGMGYVPPEQSAPGTRLQYEVGGRRLKAAVVEKPFLKR